MIFRRPNQNYGRIPQPETPYQKAGQLWDERIGSARVQAKNWRLMAFACFVLSACLSAALIWQSMQSRVTPYVVEVNKFGEVRAVASASKDYEPTDAQVAWHLARFITNVRSISADPVLVRRNWLSAYDFTADKAILFLNAYAKDKDPFAQIGTNSVSVQVTSVIRASDSSFQVKWTEESFERGALVGAENWTAILGITLQTPHTAKQLRKNPLGLFIKAVDWSRELDITTTHSQKEILK